MLCEERYFTEWFVISFNTDSLVILSLLLKNISLVSLLLIIQFICVPSGTEISVTLLRVSFFKRVYFG